MTKSQYTIALVLQSFGITRKTKRLTDAAFEMHLAQDGAELLGALCWPKTEEIEEVSMEYWNLRRLQRDQQAIVAELEEAEKKLEQAQAKRSGIQEDSAEIDKDLYQKRDQLLRKIEKIELENEQIMAEAEKTKRRISALKMKSQVLREEAGDDPELSQKRIEKCDAEIAELKKAFLKNRESITTNQTVVKKLDKKLARIKEQIATDLKESKGDTDAAYSEISEANRAISKIRAKIGLIQNEEYPLFKTIGHFLALNAKRKDCREACRENRALLKQIQLVLHSAQLNRKLAERFAR